MRILPNSFFALILSLPAALVAAETGLVPSGRSGIDPVSAECIVCHDGTIATKAGFCLLIQGETNVEGHAISASYVERAERNPQLRPPASLPSALELYDGRITCVTCHGGEPHGGTPLAIDNRGSALCSACHLK